MGFRFQKRISILPGVRINLSKSGASASLGPRGADVNIGRDGVTANAGIPGTGLSYREKIGKSGKKLPRSHQEIARNRHAQKTLVVDRWPLHIVTNASGKRT